MFKQNKLSHKINSVAADLCSYSTQNYGACQDAAYTKIIDRVIATITGIDVTRRIMWGDAAAPSVVYGCRVETGYTPSQAKLAYTVLNGLAALHSQIGQSKFNAVLFGLKFLTRDSGWQQDLLDRKADLLREIAELEVKIYELEARLAERTAEYRRNPTDDNRWRMQWTADDIRGEKYRLGHYKEAVEVMKTPEAIIADLRAALVTNGILPA